MKLKKSVVLFIFMCCFITCFFLKPTAAKLRFSRTIGNPFNGENNNNNSNNSNNNSNNSNNNNYNGSNDKEDSVDFEELDVENTGEGTGGVFANSSNGYVLPVRNESVVGEGNFHGSSNSGNHHNVGNIEKTTANKDEVKNVQEEYVFDERDNVFETDEVEEETKGVLETRGDEERNKYFDETSVEVNAIGSDEDSKEEIYLQEIAREESGEEDFGEDETDIDAEDDKIEALYEEDDSDTVEEEEDEEEELETAATTAASEEEDDDEATIEGVVQEVREEDVSTVKENNSNEDEHVVVNNSSINNTKDAIVNNKIHGFSGFLIRTKQFWTHSNIYRIFEKPISDSSPVNYFRNEMQNEFAFRNGLHFSCTSAYLYNKYVNSSKYAYIRLPESTMVILVTANKLFFQDLIYSSNKYLSIKNKFAYLMNSIVDTLKGKIFFKNYNYQYLFRSDPFAIDPTRKLLDFDLLGELSQTTQTVYIDHHTNNKVSMHKLYGGWFQFLGIMVVNGYYYNDTVKPQPIEVIPPEMLSEFRDLIYQKPVNSYNYAYSLGLWRDFPKDKFAFWRYPLELLLWDSLNILPNQLPHPANFVLAYTNTLDKLVKEEVGAPEALKKSLVKNVYHNRELLNWHILIKKFVREQTGIDVAIVKADDYYEQVGSNSAGSQNLVVESIKNKIGRSGYVLLLLLNSEFFNDKSLLVGKYAEAKYSSFFKKLVAIIDKIQQILDDIKHSLEPHIEPDVKFYNYLNSYEDSFKVFNPHILGSIAGITQHLKCDNTKRYSCKRDVSIHYKYGGWFEFGAAIFIKDIITVPLTYKKREIVKKEYENMILLQANSSYHDAGMWRDIPEKDTSPYRYSLQAFVLESPNLNIIDMQKAHPFVIIDLINKGLHAMNANVLNKFPKEKAGEENNKFADKKKNEIDTIESAEEAAAIERKILELKKKEPELNEMQLNFGEVIKSFDSYNKEFTTPANDKKEDGGENAYNAVEENDEKEEKTEENENEEDEFNVQLMGNSNDEEEYTVVNAHATYEDTEEASTIDDDAEEIEKGGEQIDDISEEEEAEEGEKFSESLKQVIDPSILGNSDENDIQEIEHVYEKTSTEHDLNLQSNEESESSSIQGSVLLWTLILLLTLFITFSVYIGVKLYERFSQRRFKNKDDIVLAFKDNDVPIVHGVPAPWLKTELN